MSSAPSGEIRHIAYGEGTLRVGPLVEAAQEAGVAMVLISEAGTWPATTGSGRRRHRRWRPSPPRPRAACVFTVDAPFPAPVSAIKEGDGFKPVGLDRPLRLSNLDKVYFPDEGYTKGDLIQYYASVAPVLLPHLAGRPLSMSRYPEGIRDRAATTEEAATGPPTNAGGGGGPFGVQVRGEVSWFLVANRVEALMSLRRDIGCIWEPVTIPDQGASAPNYAIFDFNQTEGSVGTRWFRAASY